MARLALDDAVRPARRLDIVGAAFEDIERALNRRQRVAQFMREHRQELVQSMLGSLQLLDLPPRREVARDFCKAAQMAGAVADRCDRDVGPESRAVLAHAPAFVLE